MSECAKHRPFINPMKGGMACKLTDEDGLLGKKGEDYFECYICNAYYSVRTGKTARWKKNKKVARGNSRGMWY